MIMLFFLYNESERSLQKWQINHHKSGAYVAQMDFSYSTFFDTIYFIVWKQSLIKKCAVKSGINLTETQEHLNMAVTAIKAPCFQCDSLVVVSWNS